MGLSDKKEEQMKKMPYISTQVFKSKDGKYLINRTVITSIKPVNYYKAIIDSEPKSVEDATEELIQAEIEEN
ncbi:MAG: hypothetical protein ACQER9_04200 [Nanobdellota archaeon]